MGSRSKILLLVFVVICGIASAGVGKMNPYFYDVLLGIGINIVLAAGLNLVNGYTGQFSLGHAGFMAVGAYTSAWLTLKYGYSLGVSSAASTSVYFAMLAAGGPPAGLG